MVPERSVLMLTPFPFCSMLGEKLNMTPEEAEIWIVNLIRNARLDAKIDSKDVCRHCRTRRCPGPV